MKEPLVKKSAIWKKIYLNLISKRDLKGAAFIHFTAELEKKEYIESGLPLRKAVIIPNGFDVDALKLEEKEAKPRSFRLRFGINPNSKIILFLSRISWKKGLDTLIPAFAGVNREYSQSVLVIAGGDDEGYKKNVQLQITNYKLQDKVIFTGMLTGKDRGSAFKASSVFVLPSYSENFGMAVIEAMYYKLPVVITEGVAISEEINKAGVGIVIKKDVDELKNSILDVLKNGINTKVGVRARNFVEKEYSSVEVAEKMEREYRLFLNYG